MIYSNLRALPPTTAKEEVSDIRHKRSRKADQGIKRGQGQAQPLLYTSLARRFIVYSRGRTLAVALKWWLS